MSTQIKEKFITTWDKDLTGIWKYIVPVLPDIRYRSGNDAASELCTFSKNWRNNKKELRAIFNSGLKQREKEEEEGEDEDEDGDADKLIENKKREDDTEEDSVQSKPLKDDRNRRTVSSMQRSGSASYTRDRTTRNTTGTSPQRYALVSSRPLSPVMRRRSPYNASPQYNAATRPAPSRRQRGKSARRKPEVKVEPSEDETASGESLSDNAAQEELKAHQKRVEELETQIEQLRTAQDQMEQTINELGADKTRLVDRVAELNEVNTLHVEQELQTKDVKERNSPLKVAQEYELLYSNEWLDAKQALDEYSDWKVKDKDRYEILTSTLTECYSMAQEAYANYRSVIIKLLNDPFAAARHSLKMKKKSDTDQQAENHDEENGNHEEVLNQKQKPDLSPELDEAVLRYMKIQCDAMDFRHTSKYVIASVFSTLHPLLIDHDITKSARIKHFVRACLQLSWKMVIQETQLIFDMSGMGEEFDDDRQELHPSSESVDSPGVRLDYYVYPVMLQGESVLQKALVVLDTPQDLVTDADN